MSEQPQKPRLTVDLIRHGTPHYKQGEVTKDIANDLTPEGIKLVEQNADNLANAIDLNSKVVVWSSPMGRAIQTAGIITRVLREKGIVIEEKGEAAEGGFTVFKELTELKNFQWKDFAPLMTGGDATYGGEKFSVDKNLTNPNNLGYPEFWIEQFPNLSQEAMGSLPAHYAEVVREIEPFLTAMRRIMRVLERANKVDDKPYHLIIVAHDVLISFLADFAGFFKDPNAKVLPQNARVRLERNEEGVLVTNTVEGNPVTHVDVVDEFAKRYEKK